MIMGTLANLYAIQQTFSTMKIVNKKDIIETKNIISANIIANEIIKQQLKDKSKYIYN